MELDKLKESLGKYIPPAAVDRISGWIIEYKVHLKVAKSRYTKLGDYRHPYGGKGHRISVNHNLNPYSFLITLVHEIAHLTNWNKHKNKVNPHGDEWKQEFKEHMHPFLVAGIFPHDIQKALMKYMSNPKASSCSDHTLLKTLSAYDEGDQTLHLEDIADEAVFQLENGMTFRKGEKLRKRYRCLELTTNKKYLVSPLAKVTLLEVEHEH